MDHNYHIDDSKTSCQRCYAFQAVDRDYKSLESFESNRFNVFSNVNTTDLTSASSIDEPLPTNQSPRMTPQVAYYCTECNEKFDNDTDVREHIRKEHCESASKSYQIKETENCILKRSNEVTDDHLGVDNQHVSPEAINSLGTVHTPVNLKLQESVNFETSMAADDKNAFCLKEHTTSISPSFQITKSSTANRDIPIETANGNHDIPLKTAIANHDIPLEAANASIMEADTTGRHASSIQGQEIKNVDSSNAPAATVAESENPNSSSFNEFKSPRLPSKPAHETPQMSLDTDLVSPHKISEHERTVAYSLLHSRSKVKNSVTGGPSNLNLSKVQKSTANKNTESLVHKSNSVDNKQTAKEEEDTKSQNSKNSDFLNMDAETDKSMIAWHIFYQCSHCKLHFPSVKKVTEHYKALHAQVEQDLTTDQLEMCEKKIDQLYESYRATHRNTEEEMSVYKRNKEKLSDVNEINNEKLSNLNERPKANSRHTYTVIIKPVSELTALVESSVCAPNDDSHFSSDCKNIIKQNRCIAGTTTSSTNMLPENVLPAETQSGFSNCSADAEIFTNIVNIKKETHSDIFDCSADAEIFTNKVNIKKEPVDPDYDSSCYNTARGAAIKEEQCDQGYEEITSIETGENWLNHVFLNKFDNFSNVDPSHESSVEFYSEMLEEDSQLGTTIKATIKRKHDTSVSEDEENYVDVEFVSDNDREIDIKKEYVAPMATKHLQDVVEHDRVGIIETRTGYLCSMCQKHYKMKTCCKSHVVSVHIRKKYSCCVPGCLEKCDSLSTLQKHWKVQHSLVEHMCPFCKVKFQSHGSLQKHMKMGCERTFCKSKVLWKKTSVKMKSLTKWLQEYKRGYFKFLCKLCNDVHKVKGMYMREFCAKQLLQCKQSYRMPKLTEETASELHRLNTFYGKVVKIREKVRRCILEKALMNKMDMMYYHMEKKMQVSKKINPAKPPWKCKLAKCPFQICEEKSTLRYWNDCLPVIDTCDCFDDKTLELVHDLKLTVTCGKSYHDSRSRHMTLKIVDICAQKTDLPNQPNSSKEERFTLETLMDNIIRVPCRRAYMENS